MSAKETLPSVDFDLELGVGYIRFSYEDVVMRKSIRDEMFYLDYDKSKDLVGIEIMAVWAFLKDYYVDS